MELAVAIALADTEIEPSARHEIERRRRLGEQHRIVPRQHDDRSAEPQPCCARRHAGEKLKRRRDLADAGEMMLDQKTRVEAERLGLDVVIDIVAEPGAGIVGAAVRLRAAEETELHELTLSRRLR